MSAAFSAGGRRSLKFATKPELVVIVIEIVGLYLDPPENAIVLWVDEKSQIQALSRASTLPMQIGIPEPKMHDSVRHGTITSFVALDIAAAKVTGLCASHIIVTRDSWSCSSTCDGNNR